MTPTPTTTAVLRSEPTDLPSVARRFKTWRATRQRGERIPEGLWQAATELARIHGLNPTVAALKLNYYDLQSRLQASRALRGGRPHAPVFVELAPGSMPPCGEERGTVELVQANGARLILRLANVGANDLVPLVQLFLRQSA